MKIKLLGIFVAFISMSIVSCDNDDDTDSVGVIDSELAGEWQLTLYEYEGTTSTDFLGTVLETEFVGKAENIDATFIFTEDPNVVTASGSYDIVLQSEIAGQTDTQTVPVEDFTSESEWSRDGDQLIFSESLVSLDGASDFGEETSVPFIIEELTENTLRMTSEVERTFSEGGVDVVSTFTIVQEYSR